MKYSSLHWEDVREGQDLPILSKEISATTIIAGAIATRDFYPLHHDFRFAQKAGAKDILMNNITTGGFVGRYLTDWSGPEGEIKRMKFRLGMPCHPNDTLTMTGKVAKKYRDTGEHLVDVEYNFLVPDGSHCKGTATMILPARGARHAPDGASQKA
ncbi:MAG: acyl dehydratase [Chloroflexi bacterium]|nr:acyl dehydratase [Chloroflexota bacterium]